MKQYCNSYNKNKKISKIYNYIISTWKHHFLFFLLYV